EAARRDVEMRRVAGEEDASVAVLVDDLAARTQGATARILIGRRSVPSAARTRARQRSSGKSSGRSPSSGKYGVLKQYRRRSPPSAMKAPGADGVEVQKSA